MIEAYIYRNKSNDIYGFKITNHGQSIVCAATSVLALNTANSIEKFTDANFECDYDTEGGYLWLEINEIKKGNPNHDAQLLLKSLELGLQGIQLEYENDIKIFNQEVQ